MPELVPFTERETESQPISLSYDYDSDLLTPPFEPLHKTSSQETEINADSIIFLAINFRYKTTNYFSKKPFYSGIPDGSVLFVSGFRFI